MKRFRAFIAVLVLIGFGVPSVAGSDLHLLLDCSCVCHECAEKAAQSVLSKFQDSHDETTCFLCHYFSTPADAALPKAAMVGESSVHRSARLIASVLSDERSSLSIPGGVTRFFSNALFFLRGKIPAKSIPTFLDACGTAAPNALFRAFGEGSSVILRVGREESLFVPLILFHIFK